jgi:4-amino-4-deoxy-L-arabinose transferase-like glycosyltransferase
MAEKEISIEIKNPEIILLLIVLFFFLVVELNVTLEKPIVFGDEGFHARMAQMIAQDLKYHVWNPVHFTKITAGGFSGPPLIHLTIAGFLFLLGNNELIIRSIIPFMVFLTGFSVYLVGRKLYNKKIGFIASILTVTMPSFVTYSVLIYKDILVTLYVVMFFLLFYLGIKKNRRIYFISSGAFGALAYLSKTSGFVAPIFVFLLSIYELLKTRKFSENLKNYSISFLFIVLLTSPFFLRNIVYYKTPVCDFPYISGSIFSTEGCTSGEFEDKYEFEGRTQAGGTEESAYKIGIMNYLEFAYGNIWFVVFGFCAGLFILLSKMKKNDILVILMFSIFLPVFYYSGAGRAEDAARFTLIWVPFIALIASKWFEEIYNFIKKYQKNLALIIFVLILYFSYVNFSQKLSVMAQVKQFSSSFFEACDWIKENTPEDIIISTVWSHRASYNCERTIIGHDPDIYLSRNVTYTKEVAKKLGVTHLFIQKFSLSDKAFSESYKIESVQFFEDNPETFKKVFENGHSLEQCLQQGGCDGNIVYEIIY